MHEKDELDYLLIPAGWKKQREKRALEEIKSRKINNIFILNGFDSEEDILYLGKILKDKEKIGFVTFPIHYLEYLDLIKRAKEQGKFPKEIITENIKTQQTARQTIYGILSLFEEKIKRKKEINYFEKRHKSTFLVRLRRLIVQILKFPDKYQKELYGFYPK